MGDARGGKEAEGDTYVERGGRCGVLVWQLCPSFLVHPYRWVVFHRRYLAGFMRLSSRELTVYRCFVVVRGGGGGDDFALSHAQ